jgi:hypothetical protein
VLSVLTVNIGAASQERARLLLNWLARRPEEVLVITETSAGPGTSWLLDRFRRAGFTVIKTPDADGERSEKTLHANPGKHADMPSFETDSSLQFFARHLGEAAAL